MISGFLDFMLAEGQYRQIKMLIESFTGLDKDALHIHIGLAIFIIVRLCWRWRGGWIVAWLAALAAAFFGEWLDLRGDMTRKDLTPDTASGHDIWNTMLWPTILLAIGPWLQPGIKAGKKSEETADSLREDDTEAGDKDYGEKTSAPVATGSDKLSD